MDQPRGAAPHDAPGSCHRGARKVKDRDAAINAAHHALTAAGVPMSPSKVAKLIQKFDRMAGSHGMTFHQFLEREANLPAVAVRRVLVDPDLWRVISYSDETGEKAVAHVMRERGYGERRA